MAQASGFVEWFHPLDGGQELDRANYLAQVMSEAGFAHCRFNLSWAELVREQFEGVKEGESFYDKLIPLLARHFQLLPNLSYTPPSWSVSGTSASPPKEEKYLQYFEWWIGEVCRRWGSYFTHLEIWNEPNSSAYWKREDDPFFDQFARLAKIAAQELRQQGKFSVLGGPSPIDMRWFETMKAHEVIDQYDVVGIHGFPGTWDSVTTGNILWQDWENHLRDVREYHPVVWITEVGATRSIAGLQEEVYESVSTCSAERYYWYSAMDYDRSKMTMQEQAHGFISPHDFTMGLMSRDRTESVLLKRLETVKYFV
jgi:CDP-paratose 2-epimerase